MVRVTRGVMAGSLYFTGMKPPASRRPFHPLSLTWTWYLCLALTLRALVPAGTMLDLKAGHGLMPGLVLCPEQTGMALAGHAHSDKHPSSHACPLCLLAQQAGGSPLPATMASWKLPAIQAAVVVIRLSVAVAGRQVPGAPLGPRAPPGLSSDRLFSSLRLI